MARKDGHREDVRCRLRGRTFAGHGFGLRAARAGHAGHDQELAGLRRARRRAARVGGPTACAAPRAAACRRGRQLRPREPRTHRRRARARGTRRSGSRGGGRKLARAPGHLHVAPVARRQRPRPHTLASRDDDAGHGLGAPRRGRHERRCAGGVERRRDGPVVGRAQELEAADVRSGEDAPGDRDVAASGERHVAAGQAPGRRDVHAPGERHVTARQAAAERHVAGVGPPARSARASAEAPRAAAGGRDGAAARRPCPARHAALFGQARRAPEPARRSRPAGRSRADPGACAGRARQRRRARPGQEVAAR
jgi:hypothetical protein